MVVQRILAKTQTVTQVQMDKAQETSLRILAETLIHHRTIAEMLIPHRIIAEMHTHLKTQAKIILHKTIVEMLLPHRVVAEMLLLHKVVEMQADTHLRIQAEINI